ncbi:hypothetical protein DAKH74_044000 [Maudiozyma humilis]|uniref:Uncharacterized protein n=1 Tax=Maudiozyma humilis TaxID=51915 RepID=A0AAV5S4Y9_MAUHU|nr:hypothetical protein DAKH74_044000 [Kazachstania humilis]
MHDRTPTYQLKKTSDFNIESSTEQIAKFIIKHLKQSQCVKGVNAPDSETENTEQAEQAIETKAITTRNKVETTDDTVKQIAAERSPMPFPHAEDIYQDNGYQGDNPAVMLL